MRKQTETESEKTERERAERETEWKSDPESWVLSKLHSHVVLLFPAGGINFLSTFISELLNAVALLHDLRWTCSVKLSGVRVLTPNSM